jgi:hypothetical protein
VAGTGSEGRFGFLRFERGYFSGLAIVSILQDSKVSFHIWYIYILSIRGKEYAMSFLLSFVDRGYGFPGDAQFVKGIDIEPSISITDSKDMPISPVQAQVAGSVIEVNVLMFLIGTILV